MGMLDSIRDLMTGQRYGDLSQAQTEAFIDALAFAMLVDGHAAGAEESKLTDAFDEFAWNGDMPLEVYVDGALDRAEACAEDKRDPDAYCRKIADQLDDPSLQKEVYYVSAQVACADEEIEESERLLLSNFVDAFDIEREQLQMMTKKLMKQI